MDWFKCPEIDNPIMLPIRTQFGVEGYGYACFLIAEATRQNCFEIDVEHLCNWLSIRKPKAQKLLPLLQKLLNDYCDLMKITPVKSDKTKNYGELPEIKAVKSDKTENYEKLPEITVITSRLNPLPDYSLIEENRIEEIRGDKNRESGKGQNRSSPRSASGSKTGTRLSADWVLPPDWSEWARSEWPDGDIGREASKFQDYWVAQPGQKGVKLDWFATWRNWIRSNIERRSAGKIPTRNDRIAPRHSFNPEVTML